jgi:phosphoadenosine phosphosulfate reductase
MEARHDRLWEAGREGLDQYNQIRKIEPMNRALHELGAKAWITGLRRVQSNSRADTPLVQMQKGFVKLNPLADWSDQQVWRYMRDHDLPQHPLLEQGYVSIGDVHTTRRWEPGMSQEQTRFFGVKRECGLHLD